MCWVNVEPTEAGMASVRMNLTHAIAVEEYPDFFRLNYPGEGYYRVKKTPEMIEAYNSLVPVKSQPVVPAEPVSYDDMPPLVNRFAGTALGVSMSDEPFRITGLGVYETASGEHVHVVSNDGSDPETNAPWFSPRYGWYKRNGVSLTYNPKHYIVKLIKLDEVQP
jgi:hypothetical protein